MATINENIDKDKRYSIKYLEDLDREHMVSFIKLALALEDKYGLDTNITHCEHPTQKIIDEVCDYFVN